MKGKEMQVLSVESPGSTRAAPASFLQAGNTGPGER
jgi:hypothetical protein